VESSEDKLSADQERSKGFILFCRVQGAMRHVPDFPETCKAILDAVMEEMDAENCSLMLKDPVTGELSIRVARGKNEGKSVYYSRSLLMANDLNPEKGRWLGFERGASGDDQRRDGGAPFCECGWFE